MMSLVIICITLIMGVLSTILHVYWLIFSSSTHCPVFLCLSSIDSFTFFLMICSGPWYILDCSSLPVYYLQKFLLVCALCVCMSAAQSHPILWDSMDYSHQDPLAARILCPWNSQARIPEWVAIPFSKGSSWPRDETQVSRTAGRFFTI